MTNKQIIKKYAFHNFKDAKTFEAWLKTKYHGYWLNDFKDYKKSLDCIAVSGILFTMDYYDGDGELMTWGNKKKEKALTVETSNRYRSGYSDAKIDLQEAWGFRNDLTYIQ